MTAPGTEPQFAVVGHPNKGKSSIVASLAEDDSVRIAAEPGTTTHARRYPMCVGTRTLYTLIDTPGFQRARKALAWMKQHETTASGRAQIVARFVRQHGSGSAFPDECELLAPIVEGAGILYVVDGSVPFGEEYEPEMEILRWTGSPSMALINPIGESDYVDEWRRALEQYFRIVRVFDAMTAEFDKRLDLLRAFGQMRDEWRGPLGEAVEALEADRSRRLRRAAKAIADMVAEMLSLTIAEPIEKDENIALRKTQLLHRFKDKLRHREMRGREQVEEIFSHVRLSRREGEFDVVDDDLFSEGTWLRFGLSLRQLVLMGMAGGAVVGGGIDAAMGGASLLLGGLIGATAGGAAAWLGKDRIAEVKVGPLPLGGRELRAGPVKNVNLPWVVLGRAMRHLQLIADRSHARRDELRMEHTDDTNWVSSLPVDRRKTIERSLSRLRRGDAVVEELADAIEELISPNR